MYPTRSGGNESSEGDCDSTILSFPEGNETKSGGNESSEGDCDNCWSAVQPSAGTASQVGMNPRKGTVTQLLVRRPAIGRHVRWE